MLETCHIPVLLRLLCITSRGAFSVMEERIQNDRFHFQAETQRRDARKQRDREREREVEDKVNVALAAVSALIWGSTSVNWEPARLRIPIWIIIIRLLQGTAPVSLPHNSLHHSAGKKDPRVVLLAEP
ncbi:hypothetical protein D9C73_027205 [Collichthys lucidus]|uniref:Uncharacterized protein n=1 Tax=Collichthys lucidus TaxID=240159 RepID=A0A4U5VVX1_COLLU|nr:hypothetical protein D9C73_027205 [Collichthys lucidus]